MNDPKLRMTDKVAEQLRRRKQAKTEAKVEVLKERAKKRAFQEQLRHKRKQIFQAAKESDLAVHAACDEDDVAIKTQDDDKKLLHVWKTAADGLEADAKELDTEIKRLQLLWRAKRNEYGLSKDRLHKHAVDMAVRNPTRTQAKVAEAYRLSGEAWEALPTATRKKARDRAAKKRAKEICGRTST